MSQFCQSLNAVCASLKHRQIVDDILIGSKITALSMDGFVKVCDEYAVHGDGGEHYVYLWKHRNGDVFYVGSGKGDRWRSKYRNQSFLREIDKGDAVVYILLSGVDKSTALLFETYISGSFRVANITLTNQDHCFSDGTESFQDWIFVNRRVLFGDLGEAVESALLNGILLDKDYDYLSIRASELFIEEYGSEYFSQKYTQPHYYSEKNEAKA